MIIISIGVIIGTIFIKDTVLGFIDCCNDEEY